MEEAKPAPPQPTPAKLKVSRNRKRLYEAPPLSPVESEHIDTDTIADEKALLADTERHQQQTAAFRSAKARRRVDYYTAASSTVGVLPLPVLDMLAVGSLQLKLIHDLSKIYQTPFSSQRAKAAVAALLSGVQTGLIIKSLFKYVPVFGYPVMAIPSAFAVGAITYAIGRVFIYHFELGGTLLDFDAQKLRAYFQQQLKQKSAQAADKD